MEGETVAASLPRNWLTVAVLVALVGGACSGSAAENAAPATTTTSTSTTTSTTTTAPPPPPTTAKPAPPDGLGRGSKGPEVKALEEKLAALHYDAGKVDEVFDAATGHAVM